MPAAEQVGRKWKVKRGERRGGKGQLEGAGHWLATLLVAGNGSRTIGVVGSE